MTSKSHTFHPSSDSFDDRLAALQSALSRLKQARASLDSKEERLGTEGEKTDAVEIFENTLQMAIKTFDEKEMSVIRTRHLIPQEQLKEVIAVQRVLKLQGFRKEANIHRETTLKN